jgi:hypothetical protein
MFISFQCRAAVFHGIDSVLCDAHAGIAHFSRASHGAHLARFEIEACFSSRRIKMAGAIKGLDTGAQIAEIEAAAAAENAINLANTLAKVHTMGLKAAKDIVG